MKKLCFCAVSMVCSTTALQAGYNNYYAGMAPVHDSATLSSDQALQKNIKDKLSSGWFSEGYERVEVNVNNGSVTLNGTVGTTEDKNKIEKEVRNIEGVKSLTSNLIVKEKQAGKDEAAHYPQDTAASPADQQLNLKIRDEITGWFWDSYKGLSLNTVNGVVEIRGEVESLKAQQDVMNAIQKIEGVKSVKSAMHIKNNR